MASDEAIARLKSDDTILRKMFLDVLKHHHEDLSIKLDVIFALADKWCQSHAQSDFDELEKYLEEMLPNEHILVRSCTKIAFAACRFALRRPGARATVCVGMSTPAGGILTQCRMLNRTWCQHSFLRAYALGA